MINYLEIRDQPHLMRAEGTADKEPTMTEIFRVIKLRGYDAVNISVAFDALQKTWRFTAGLIEPSNTITRPAKV